MQHETAIGGAEGRFPPTCRTVVQASRSLDPEERRHALEALLAAYWKPAYRHVRLTWHAGNEEAKDLVQGFFARALEQEFLQAWDPGRARFRTWLRTCLDGHVSNERKAAGRQKRGGGIVLHPLDFAAAEDELQHSPALAAGDDPFDREWVRSLFGLAVERLRERCTELGRPQSFTLFQRYDLHDASDAAGAPSYAQLALESGLPVTQVTHHLAWARRQFRELVLAVLRELTGSEEEFRAEARELLGLALPRVPPA